jgi:hypothetical protein
MNSERPDAPMTSRQAWTSGPGLKDQYLLILVLVGCATLSVKTQKFFKLPGDNRSCLDYPGRGDLYERGHSHPRTAGAGARPTLAAEDESQPGLCCCHMEPTAGYAAPGKPAEG